MTLTQYFAIITTDNRFISCVQSESNRYNYLGNHSDISLNNAHKILMSYQDASDLLQCLFDIQNKKHTTFKGTPNFAHEKAHDLSTYDAITKVYKVIPVNISIQY